MHPHIHPSIHPSIISIHPSIHSCMRTCLHTLPFLSLPWHYIALQCVTLDAYMGLEFAPICDFIRYIAWNCVVRFPLYIQQTCWEMWRLFSFGYLYFCSCEGVPPRQIVKVFPVCKRYPEESWKLGLDSEACTCAKTILHFVVVLCCLWVVRRFALPISFLLFLSQAFHWQFALSLVLIVLGSLNCTRQRMQTLYSRQKPVQVASSHPVANSRNLFCSLADEELALQSPVSERVIAWRRFKVNWNKVCQSRHLHCVHIRGPNSSLITGQVVIVILLLLLTAMLLAEGKGWAAREVAAGSVLHAIDVGLKGQAIRTSINPGKSSCKKHLTWYTKSCCFRHKRTWHRLTQCLYMSIRIVFYNRIAPVFSRSLLDLFRQACNM